MDEIQNIKDSVQTAPENSGELSKRKRYYSSWVGMLIGLLLPGAAHFLAGQKRQGIAWHLGMLVLLLLFFPISSLPGKPFAYFAVFVFAVWIVSCIAMFISSCRPTRRLGISGWILFLLFCFCFNSLERLFLRFTVIRFCSEIFNISGMSMAPTLIAPSENYADAPTQPDRLIVNKMIYWWSEPQRGDIIVYRTTAMMVNRHVGSAVSLGCPARRWTLILRLF
jgi:hypothetical protein